MLGLSSPPLQTDFLENQPSPISRVWYLWLVSLINRIGVASYVAAAVVALTGQAASIGVTPLIPLAAAGLYRVSWDTRITTAAGTSSSISVSVHATDGTIACTQTGAANTGNATNSVVSGAFIVRCDASTALSYSTTYASVGAPAMVYRVDLVVERLA